jgi:thioredoxin-like negative regulator of GroEL
MRKNLVKETDFDSFLQNNCDKLVLVKFFTVWCPPCQELQKNIEKLLAELEQESKEASLAVLEVDAEKFPQLSQRLKVYSVPTIFLFRHEKDQMIIKEKRSGNMSVRQLREFIGIR